MVLQPPRSTRSPTLSPLPSLSRSWLVVLAGRPVLRALTPTQLAWLVAGGLLYTVGVPFYVWSRRYSHAIWHLFVLGGAACHLMAIVDAISHHR